MTKTLIAYRSVDISALTLTIELLSCFIQGSYQNERMLKRIHQWVPEKILSANTILKY